MQIDGAWKLTSHAARRIHARNLQPEHLLAALEKPGAMSANSRRRKYYDKRSKCVVVVDERDHIIVTAYKMRPRDAKNMKRQARG